MKLLFVHGSLTHGGIETLIVRLAEYFVTYGHQVDLLLLFGSGESELLARFKRFGRILRTGTRWEFPLLFQHAAISQIPDRVLSFGMNSLLHALVVSKRSDFGAPIAAAIYFPRELCWKSAPQAYRQLLARRLVTAMPTQNLAFVSAAARQEHRDCLAMSLDQSKVLPIPVNTASFKNATRTARTAKIVSVGRLVDFKTYNWIMLDAIDELRSNGVDLEYHVYGDGPKKDLLARRISEKNLEACVHLHGEVPYESLRTVLSDATVFVGMGTSLIEAAACGVPSLVAIESCPFPYSYGLFHEQPTSTIGELENGRIVVPLVDALRHILAADRVTYERLCVMSREAAEAYSMEKVCPAYIDFLREAVSFSFAFDLRDKLFDFVDLLRWEIRRGLHLKTPFDGRYEGPRTSIANNRINLVNR